MKNNLSVICLAISVLVLAALACSVPGGGALLEDDFSGENWGTGTDSDSSVEYSNDEPTNRNEMRLFRLDPDQTK